MTVASTAEYLKEIWPSELDHVSVEVAGVPSQLGGSLGVDREVVARFSLVRDDGV